MSVVQFVKPTATLAAPIVTCNDSVIVDTFSVPSAVVFAPVSGNRPLLSPNANATAPAVVPTVQVSNFSESPSVALKSKSTVARLSCSLTLIVTDSVSDISASTGKEGFHRLFEVKFFFLFVL